MKNKIKIFEKYLIAEIKTYKPEKEFEREMEAIKEVLEEYQIFFEKELKEE